MLDFAINHKVKLVETHRRFVTANLDHCKYWIHSTWLNYELTIEESSWNKIQCVSVLKDGSIQGYISATVDNVQGVVDNFTIIGYNAKCSPTLYRDAHILLKRLLSSNYRKILFSSVVGSPAEKINNKIIEKFNGRVVGVKNRDIKLLDGNIYDVKIYEIFK